MTTVLTVGHGARGREEFLGLLEGAGVERLVDVRTAPGSRKHPHFGKDVLEAALEDRGIAYAWRRDMGGWRKPRPDSRHTALRSDGFRGYADHMETEEFRAAFRWLVQTSSDIRTAVMCAESLWWRCHRSMLADALVAGGCEVCHLMPDGDLAPHRLRPFVRVEDGRPVYDRG